MSEERTDLPAPRVLHVSSHARPHMGGLETVIAAETQGLAARGWRVTLVDAERNRVVVEGVNLVKRHTKPNPQKQVQGGIVEQEASIHASNVMLVDGKGTTRIGFKKVEGDKRRPDGSTYKVQRSVRVSRRTGEEI